MTVSTTEIIHKYCEGKMSARPSFFAGRGNRTGDLNSDLLERIYGGIKVEIGKPAAKAFVNMVSDITEDASATTFLISLQHLESTGWKYKKKKPVTEAEALAETTANALRDSSRGDMAACELGLAGMFAGMRGNDPVEWITGSFLMKHADEIEGGLDIEKYRTARTVNYYGQLTNR